LNEQKQPVDANRLLLSCAIINGEGQLNNSRDFKVALVNVKRVVY